jgi:small subunit ribosomal protein S4
MSRYAGPKGRVNRRLGAMVFETAGASKALEKRPNPPGMHPKQRRTDYGAALNEKQKVKYYYGLGERQLRRYFARANAMKGNTGENLLILCERRLDNIVRRAGFTKTRPQARQGIVHGHFQVNGIKVTKPAFMLKPGDVITVKGREQLHLMYKAVLADSSPQTPDWLQFDGEALRCSVLGLPGPSDVSLPVDIKTVTEFMGR